MSTQNPPSLNPMQREAVYHKEGPLLLLAGAGSGKTRVITHRLAELVAGGVPPERLLAVTFTNKAASEMRERIGHLLQERARSLWIGTFHAIAARLLRTYGSRIGLARDFVVLDEADQRKVLEGVLREMALTDEGKYDPRVVLGKLDALKNAGKEPEDVKVEDRLLSDIYAKYQTHLSLRKALDFGDLLVMPSRLCREVPQVKETFARLFSYVMVDEFQDVNGAQYRFLRLFCEKSRQLCVVGDDDQAIYGWRGAQVDIILGFDKDWPDATVIRLEQNYRSTQLILDAANAVVRHNQERHNKTLFSENKGGAAITIYSARDDRHEAEFVATTIRDLIKQEGKNPSDFAICYRINEQSKVLQEALRQMGLPHSVVGGRRLYDRAEIKDLLAWLRVAFDPEDDLALRRIINVPPRGIGETTINKVANKAAKLAKASGGGLFATMKACAQEEGFPIDLGAGLRKKLAEFVSLVETLHKGEGTVLDRLSQILSATGYLESLAEESQKENVRSLMQTLSDRQQALLAEGSELTLVGFLEEAALTSTADAKGGGVTLLTVHAAKGLEYNVVFVTGMEDGLFPSLRRRGDGGDVEEDEENEAEVRAAEVAAIEEERRLFYVAITRAKERLYVSYARRRSLYGRSARDTVPSRFLEEIPNACVFRKKEPETAFAKSSDPKYNQTTQGSLPLGQKVDHVSFGRGEVRSISGTGHNEKAEVYFDTVGPKTILTRFLKVVSS